MRSRGHRVTFLQIDLELKVRSQGVDFYPIGKATYKPGTMAKTAIDFLTGDRHPDEAAQMVIEALKSKVKGEAGCILNYITTREGIPSSLVICHL